MARHNGPAQGVSMIAPNRPPSKQHEAGRVCAHEECDTKLSIYNKKAVCSIHEDFERVPSGGWFSK